MLPTSLPVNVGKSFHVNVTTVRGRGGQLMADWTMSARSANHCAPHQLLSRRAARQPHHLLRFSLNSLRIVCLAMSAAARNHGASRRKERNEFNSKGRIHLIDPAPISCMKGPTEIATSFHLPREAEREIQTPITARILHKTGPCIAAKCVSPEQRPLSFDDVIEELMVIFRQSRLILPLPANV
jgi:hypothetical protein